MAYRVSMTADAVRDLDRIIEHIAEHDLAQRALHVLDAVERTVQGLGEQPNRGSAPKELADLGTRDSGEAYFKPYRIIYRVFERKQQFSGAATCRPCSASDCSTPDRAVSQRRNAPRSPLAAWSTPARQPSG